MIKKKAKFQLMYWIIFCFKFLPSRERITWNNQQKCFCNKNFSLLFLTLCCPHNGVGEKLCPGLLTRSKFRSPFKYFSRGRQGNLISNQEEFTFSKFSALSPNKSLKAAQGWLYGKRRVMEARIVLDRLITDYRCNLLWINYPITNICVFVFLSNFQSIFVFIISL